MDEETLPSAQGTDTEPNSETTQPQVNQETKAQEGIQQRINELTARFHESERSREALMSTIAEQQTAIAQMTQRLTVPEEPEELDPTNPAHLQRIIEKATAPLHQKLEQMNAQAVNAQVNTVMADVQAKLKKLNNPSVAARVNQLVATWDRGGQLKSGVATPRDALLIAMGELAEGQLLGGAQSRDERRAFNAGGGVMAGQSIRATRDMQTSAGLEETLSNVDLNDLPFDQLNALIGEIEKKHPDGVPLK
jgi:hypothetical protein